MTAHDVWSHVWGIFNLNTSSSVLSEQRTNKVMDNSSVCSSGIGLSKVNRGGEQSSPRRAWTELEPSVWGSGE